MDTSALTSSIISDITTTETSSPIGGEENIENVTDVTSSNPDLSHGLSVLAKKEKALLMKQQQIQKQLKEMEEKSKKFNEWEEMDKLASENPNEFFKKKGLSFEQIQQKMLESMQDDELDPIQKQLKELQQKLSAKDQEFQKLLDEKFNERDAQKKNQEIEEQSKYYAQELKTFLAEKADDYDLINTFDAGDEVFSVIKSVYLKTAETGTPKLMTFDEACNLYEKKLEELVQGMKKSKKVSNIFGASDIDDPFATVSGHRTLDDSFSQSSATSPELKSEDERMKAAARLFEQQMKSL